MLRIYFTPEREVFAKVSVQLFRLHASYTDLPGVDYIDPDVDAGVSSRIEPSLWVITLTSVCLCSVSTNRR